MKNIEEFEDLNKKKILLRLDLNVPIENKRITDTTRIDKILPTLDYLIKKKSYIIDVGSNDGVALKPFLDLGFKKLLGIEPAKNLSKLSNKNNIKTFNGFLEKKNFGQKKIDLIFVSSYLSNRNILVIF